MKTLLLSTLFFLGTSFSYAQLDSCAVAGEDSTLTVTQNEPFNLFDGLGGTYTMTGTWFLFGNSTTPDFANGLPIPGQFPSSYVNQKQGCPPDTANVLVIVEIDFGSWGLTEVNIEGLSIYPNPAKDFVTISNEGPHQDLRYTLFSVDGSIVRESTLNEIGTQNISISALKNGIYYFHIWNDEIRSVYKILKE